MMPQRGFWSTITRYQADKVHIPMAVRNAVAVTVPLALGLATGALASSAAFATGALNVSFSDGSDPYLPRALRMMTASVVVGVAVCAGTLFGHEPVTATLVATMWAFAAGFLVALSNAAPDLGLVSLVTLVVFYYHPLPPHEAVLSGVLAFAGGLLSVFLALALWPLQRYHPERQALAALYSELSRAAVTPAPAATEAPLASAQSTQAQQTLHSLARDHSVHAERYHSLLNQAERLRLSLMTLSRLQVRIGRERVDCPALDSINRFFEVSARTLRAVADSILSGAALTPCQDDVQQLHRLADALRHECERDSSPLHAMLLDARFQMDAMAGQVRAAVDLASHASQVGEAEFDRRELRRPWQLRLSGALATLRANLHLQSPALRHALRLAVVVGTGEALCRYFQIDRGYWIPMTIALVLKPDFGSTFSRGVLRLCGTFTGLAVSTALIYVVPSSPPWEVFMVCVWMFVVRAWGAANYGILSAAVAGLVVSLIAVAGIPPSAVIAARGINTAIGGVLALAAYAAWPTPERPQITEALARMLDAYREYFRAVRLAYENVDQGFTRELEHTRLAARLARSQVEASAERLAAEPDTTDETNRAVTAILASTHRLIHAVMSLEGGLAGSPPVRARPAFSRLATQFEFTLYYLASALRGARLAPEELPDLREIHHELISTGDPATRRYALVNVETDRLTNSVNTLAGHIFRWLAPHPESREEQPV